MATKRAAGHGGRRAGAGRKRLVSHPERIAIDLERPDLDALRALALARESSVAQLVRIAVAQFLKRARR
jgi:hypothetical protein